LTTRVTVVLWTRVPLVPVIVSTDDPVGVEVDVVTVMVELPDVVTEAGLKEAAAPEGRPLALKLTVPVKPPLGVTVAV
jgi:hypothetical protein